MTRRRAALHLALAVALAMVAGALSACGGGGGGADTPRAGGGGDAPSEQRNGGTQASSSEGPPPAPRPYRPLPAEDYSNGKRLAAEIAQRVTTYDQGASARAVAARLGPGAVGEPALSETIEPLVDPTRYSRGEVVYPQLSGVTPTSLGAMVVVRQTLSDEDGAERLVTRALDIRLRRSTGPWSLDRIGPVGGAPPESDRAPSPAAKRVLEHPRITLPDSARWDILSGDVDEGLLEALAGAAERYRLGIAVIRSGHPQNVWATTTPSAHSVGNAVDIYAVDGVPVLNQRQEGSAAFELASELVDGGAAQIGSPWILGAGGSQSFTDEVHQDHIHLQQTPTG